MSWCNNQRLGIKGRKSLLLAKGKAILTGVAVKIVFKRAVFGFHGLCTDGKQLIVAVSKNMWTSQTRSKWNLKGRLSASTMSLLS